MTGESNEPVGVDVEPSVRPIARLAPALAPGPTSTLGVLPPFSGLLGPVRRGVDRRPAPVLEYLTLHPLVVEHLHEHAPVERWTETLERLEPTDEAAPSDDGPSDGDLETMTVREYLVLQQQADPADGGDGGPDARRFALDTRGPTPTVRDPRQRTSDSPPRSSPGDPVDDAAAGGPSPTIDEDRLPRTPSPAAAVRPPVGTPLDATPTTLTSTRPGPRSWPTPSGRPSSGASTHQEPSPPATDDGPFGTPYAGHGGPPLVIADRPVPVATAGRGEESDASPLTVESRRPRERARVDEPTSEGPVGRSTADGPRQAAARPAVGPSTPAPAAAERTGEVVVADPVAALDDLDRPALDRFVERLTDELARHDRIERERRGR